MAGALSPVQAVAYVRELSADVRAVAVVPVDGAGAAAADPPGFAGAARDALPHLRAAATDGELVVRAPGGGLVFAAVGDRHAVVATAGPLGLAGPTALDVRAAHDALGGETGPAGLPPAVLEHPDSALLREISALVAAD